jgi:phosphatidate cytidylyltransferase
MAFNWKTFRIRTASSLVFVLVMLIGLLWNQWSFLILFSIIHFGCWWEYLRLMEKIHKISFHTYVKLGLMFIGYGLMLWFCGPFYEINGYGIKENFSLPVSVAGFAVLLIGIFQKNAIQLKSFGAAALGLLYISLSWGFMIDFYLFADMHVDNTLFVLPAYTIPVVIIVSIWMNDTMAYLVGSMIGKTPLTKISPKKTWEGTIGGIILSVLIVSLLLPLLFQIPGNAMRVILAIIAFVASLTGTFGDLFESKLKRMANVKDSGNMMPGHGGFLDRFDSLLFAIPCVWVLLFFLNMSNV